MKNFRKKKKKFRKAIFSIGIRWWKKEKKMISYSLLYVFYGF